MSAPTYERELIAQMLDDAALSADMGDGIWRAGSIREQAELLRAADNADAAGVRTVNTTGPVRALIAGWEAKADALDADDEIDLTGQRAAQLRECAADLRSWAALASAPPSVPVGVDAVMVPKEPSEGVLVSMAIRYDHGLGVPGYYDQPVLGAENGGHKRRMESTVSTMRKLYEEVVGAGFYSREREEEYAALAQQPEAEARAQGGGEFRDDLIPDLEARAACADEVAGDLMREAARTLRKLSRTAPKAPAQEAFGHVYRIVSPQIPATRDRPWIGPGVNFEFGPPPADTPCVQYLALYAAPQPAIPEGTWRLLKKGEAIQRGDEVLADNCIEWGPLCGWERGMAYDPAAFVPVRRRIKEPDHG